MIRTMNYQKVSRLSEMVRENNDCSVRAVSILCDVPYKVAHRALQWVGRKNRKGASKLQIEWAIEKLGFCTEEVQTYSSTVAQLESDPNVQKGYYYVLVKGHIASVVNGQVEDWTRGRRHRVLTVSRVTPCKTRKERKAMAKALFN